MIQHGCWELQPSHSHSRQQEGGTKERKKEYAHPLLFTEPSQKSRTATLITSQWPEPSRTAAPDHRGGRVTREDSESGLPEGGE